eukprot:782230-Amphidinium_carterae.1
MDTQQHEGRTHWTLLFREQTLPSVFVCVCVSNRHPSLATYQQDDVQCAVEVRMTWSCTDTHCTQRPTFVGYIVLLQCHVHIHHVCNIILKSLTQQPSWLASYVGCVEFDWELRYAKSIPCTLPEPVAL